MQRVHSFALLSAILLACGAALPPAGAQEEFRCRKDLFGTQHCHSEGGTSIKSRPDLFGNTNSTITDPDGDKLRCRSRPDLFGRIHTVCE